jgi:hypothetical protein
MPSFISSVYRYQGRKQIHICCPQFGEPCSPESMRGLLEAPTSGQDLGRCYGDIWILSVSRLTG